MWAWPPEGWGLGVWTPNPPHPHLTSAGIPPIQEAWGLWALFGAATLLLLFSLTVHLYWWIRALRSRHRRQER